LSYRVQVGSKVWRRHIDQLITRVEDCRSAPESFIGFFTGASALSQPRTIGATSVPNIQTEDTEESNEPQLGDSPLGLGPRLEDSSTVSEPRGFLVPEQEFSDATIVPPLSPVTELAPTLVLRRSGRERRRPERLIEEI